MPPSHLRPSVPLGNKLKHMKRGVVLPTHTPGVVVVPTDGTGGVTQGRRVAGRAR